jgi:hypothetical protein
LEKITAYFFNACNFAAQTLWFKRLLYVLLVIKAIAWLYRYNLYFGPEAIIYTGQVTIQGPDDLAFLLYTQSSSVLSSMFIWGVLGICLLRLTVLKLYFFPDLVLWFLVLNIHNKLYPTLTGGDYLLNQFLLFNCFLTASCNAGETWWPALKRLLHNLAVTGIMVQVCLVYLFSALAKCLDPMWLSGEAVYTVSRLQHYSSRTNLWNGPGFLPAFLNYLALFYQLLFPLLIWFKKIKKPLILLGIGMHLYIGFFIGLPGFAAVMILGYIYFWPPREESGSH